MIFILFTAATIFAIFVFINFIISTHLLTLSSQFYAHLY
ncbi:putative membrane protein [Enterobacter hormaechei subsp. hoffmannii]|nr:putative membrane protein [Enterobacter hormaechei subsp. hoffmannii]